MKRRAETCYPLHELLRDRWSPLAFADRPVERETLAALFEAARWAPSCYNEQPWTFVVATRDDSVAFDRLAACLVDANRVWAARAPVLMLAIAKLHFGQNRRENRHAWYDLGQAMAHLTVQAGASGLLVHQMAGFDPAEARQTYGIPESHEAAAMAALGYYGNLADLPNSLRQRETAPRQRRPLEQIVFEGAWGSSFKPRS